MENPINLNLNSPYDDLTDKEFTAPQPLLILECSTKVKQVCTLDCAHSIFNALTGESTR